MIFCFYYIVRTLFSYLTIQMSVLVVLVCHNVILISCTLHPILANEDIYVGKSKAETYPGDQRAMPNEYSVEIHKYISKKIKEAEQLIDKNGVDTENNLGKIDELLWLREYLSDNIDLKDFKYY